MVLLLSYSQLSDFGGFQLRKKAIIIQVLRLEFLEAYLLPYDVGVDVTDWR